MEHGLIGRAAAFGAVDWRFESSCSNRFYFAWNVQNSRIRVVVWGSMLGLKYTFLWS